MKLTYVVNVFGVTDMKITYTAHIYGEPEYIELFKREMEMRFEKSVKTSKRVASLKFASIQADQARNSKKLINIFSEA